jgi:hypothetical protein
VGNGGFDVAHAPCKLSRDVDSPAGSTCDDIHINPVDHGRSASRLYERPRREPRGQRRSRRCPPYDARNRSLGQDTSPPTRAIDPP